jgi:hypothetical protein
MPLYPPAIKKLIPPGSSDPRIKARVVILHVRAGTGPSLYDYFNGPSGGIESHFYIRFDGTCEQYRDTAFQADANLDANDFALSVETEGLGDGKWTPDQLDAIKDLLLWAHRVHGIPLRKIQAWNGSGVGYHTLFGAPSHWTPVAKSCPGPNRIVQFDEVLVPWMRRQGATSVARRAARRQERRRTAVAADLSAAQTRLQAVRARVRRLRARLARLSR